MLKIYNALTNQVEDFKPIHHSKVNMYVCGPTVYDDIHIGNGRPVVFFDLVKRYLTYLGYEVIYASNITDVDDKIIEKARLLNQDTLEVSKHFADRFLDVVKRVGSKAFDHTPYATDYINEMITYIQELMDKGFAYETSSGVYFSVSKLDSYGKLSNQKSDELLQGVRIELEKDKVDQRDFAIWKKTTDGLNYMSPWGQGRPGWHTECAVMNHELFGGLIDIHGGGFDLKFPHHENEIAQSSAHDHHDLAKYWMHVGRLDFGKEKMSKSLGNDVKLFKLLDHFSPSAYRLMLFAHHYRQPIPFSEELMTQYQKAYDKISYTLNKWNFHMALENNHIAQPSDTLLKTFEAYMNDDFNTGMVVTLIDQTLKEINKSADSELAYALIQILDVLGIEVTTHKVEAKDLIMYQEWLNYKAAKDFKKADELRQILIQKGWI
ncbi:Cysteine--tRNA ligase [Acholeplasma oculi]|uniref:Cysteine--tRNA ligase n=1 Tax=Acholeplasma oculi TaxID=35623 RepID=A0A061AID6_9MOLU|nr:cysteine--tRNA ligase [Acholeplasma oculi]CDR31386.1 Cysteinyl-tRNA synthetase [Acholeplasma oculi]SKC39591.1 cysteinyl-tRNA synthetase [Acholeplasma oculi]SUT91855.1 Cysteine--tRNA ligase [Acholeplasma oculi]